MDALFHDFELDHRTILHYGDIDPRFMRDYFARHSLAGFERMHFFNFKRLICSTGYSDGTLTKDNLCEFFGIDGVKETHDSLIDCKLEWELFKKLDGRFLLARIVPNGQHHGMWRLAILNPGYIVPVSYLATFRNLSRIIERPYIRCDSEDVFSLEISGQDVLRFPTNSSGMIIENLLNALVGVTKANNIEFLMENSAKNELLGYMPSSISFIPMSLNSDGTVTATRKEDREYEKRLIAMIEQVRSQLEPLARFISDEVFHGSPVTSQELVVNDELGILSLCDLSTDDAVLEIKTSKCDPQRYAEQLYYEANGRTSYLLGMDWYTRDDRTLAARLTLKRVKAYPGEKPNQRRDRAVASLSSVLALENIEIIQYTNSTSPIMVRCKKCGSEWRDTYAHIKASKCACLSCHPARYTERRKKGSAGASKPKRVALTPEQALAKRAQRYAEKPRSAVAGLLKLQATLAGKAPFMCAV